MKTKNYIVKSIAFLFLPYNFWTFKNPAQPQSNNVNKNFRVPFENSLFFLLVMIPKHYLYKFYDNYQWYK